MKNVLYTGRPEDVEGRLEKEIACYDLLDGLGVSYTRVDHDFADTIGQRNDIALAHPTHVLALHDELVAVVEDVVLDGDDPAAFGAAVLWPAQAASG